HDIIHEKKVQFPRYAPIGTFWDFQFCPSEKGIDNAEIEPGSVQVISAPTSEKSWAELSSEHIKVSISSKHSKYSKYDLNPNTFANIDILSKGHFRVKFNKDLFASETATSSATNSSVTPKKDKLATIQFVVNKQRYSYPMREKQLKITKALDGLTSSATLLCINDPTGSLQKEHIMIKYEEAARLFYIALFADAFVNEQRLELSRTGDNPVWHPLKNESSIVCGIFQLDFTAEV
ncbi:MAG TPA: hypothetical protein PLP80_11270, partial [Niabella sp.]|nr:hypothetical protein [Niabella sp.]